MFFTFGFETLLFSACYTQPITSVMLGGNLPLDATNLTDLKSGTNCTFTVFPLNVYQK